MHSAYITPFFVPHPSPRKTKLSLKMKAFTNSNSMLASKYGVEYCFDILFHNRGRVNQVNGLWGKYFGLMAYEFKFLEMLCESQVIPDWEVLIKDIPSMISRSFCMSEISFINVLYLRQESMF